MGDPLFKKIPQKKVSEKVFEQIRKLIVSGSLTPGDKLPPERELTSLFEVSRSSVREAILKLECLGFVEQKHGEGTFIRSFTETSVKNYVDEFVKEGKFLSGLMEIRHVLEIWAASTAATRATKREVLYLKEIVEKMKGSTRKKKADHELNVALHRKIAESTHNPFLVHMMESILIWLETVTRKIYFSKGYDEKVHDSLIAQHTLIVESIAKGDAEKASAAMMTHLNFSGSWVEGSE